MDQVDNVELFGFFAICDRGLVCPEYPSAMVITNTGLSDITLQTNYLIYTHDTRIEAHDTESALGGGVNGITKWQVGTQHSNFS